MPHDFPIEIICEGKSLTIHIGETLQVHCLGGEMVARAGRPSIRARDVLSISGIESGNRYYIDSGALLNARLAVAKRGGFPDDDPVVHPTAALTMARLGAQSQGLSAEAALSALAPWFTADELDVIERAAKWNLSEENPASACLRELAKLRLAERSASSEAEHEETASPAKFKLADRRARR